MKAKLKRIGQWCIKYWYLFILAFTAILGFLLRGLFIRRADGRPVTENFQERARTKVDAVDCETMKKKAEVLAVTVALKQELVKLEQIDDVRLRRRLLARFLKDNL